ncbi:MAG TPA: hypothetical protein VF055_08590, partial [Steroidobacteraceae bacterium]
MHERADHEHAHLAPPWRHRRVAHRTQVLALHQAVAYGGGRDPRGRPDRPEPEERARERAR